MNTAPSFENPSPGAKPRKRLLIVEDAENMPVLLDDRLSLDFEVDLAFSGQEALSRIRTQRPDMILADVSSPVVGGVDFLSTLQKDEDTRSIPTVVFVQGPLEKALQRRMHAMRNVRGFLRKPVSYADLKGLLSGISLEQEGRGKRPGRERPAPPPAPTASPAAKAGPAGPPAARSWFFWTGVGASVLLGFVWLALAEGLWRLAERSFRQETFNPPLSSSSSLPYAPLVSRRWEQAGIPYVLNNRGLRGGDLPVKKRLSAYRVLVLGGTNVFGQGIRPEDLLTSRLQTLLNDSSAGSRASRYEVVNGAGWALSLEDQWSFFQETGASLRPDVVVWFWDSDGRPALNPGRLRMWARLPGPVQALFSRSHLFRGLREAYLRGGKRTAPDVAALAGAVKTYAQSTGSAVILAAPAGSAEDLFLKDGLSQVFPRVFYFTVGKKLLPAAPSGWSPLDHDRLARLFEKYVRSVQEALSSGSPGGSEPAVPALPPS